VNDDGLKPCPFCGNPNVHWTHCLEAAYVICDECEAQGPPFYSEGEFGHGAEDLWNKRMESQPAHATISHEQVERGLDWALRPDDEP
jgi:Lar family restriction alleviation protein